jgi:hypothetical protein
LLRSRLSPTGFIVLPAAMVCEEQILYRSAIICLLKSRDSITRDEAVK